MPRTLDPEAHTLKRDAFIDVAQRLIQTRGYEAFSIQDVLDELGASKGAFYQYFGSKADLLEAVIDRMADGVALGWADLMARPGVSATERLEGAFSTVASSRPRGRTWSLPSSSHGSPMTTPSPRTSSGSSLPVG